MTNKKLIRYDVADSQAGGQRRPFAKAVRAGDFVYVSGQVPTVGGEVIVGNIVAQTEQVIENIRFVLALADCTLEDVEGQCLARRCPRLLKLQRGLPEALHRPPASPFHGPVSNDGGRESRDGRDCVQAVGLMHLPMGA
ncbi:hypothetical protein HNQ75_003240 [Rhizobium flavum]|uniref:Uncharacterized protein n=1 Tax=Pseudorhizobium flavum TaxID=1335061 RepID=A0A7W9YZG2_9HYPH|nr:hypothetical protein [Pseudorhizobium flavum]